jgi:PTS system mannose-specific IIA component
MVETLILTHGALADALLDAATRIAGRHDGIQALSLDWNAPFETLKTRLAEELARLDHGDGVLILTDMYGNTPSNLALAFHRPGVYEVVTGVNLPMVVRLSCIGQRRMAVAALAEWIRDKGQGSILHAEVAKEEESTAGKRAGG